MFNSRRWECRPLEKINNRRWGCRPLKICLIAGVDPAFLAIMRFPLKRRDSLLYLKIKKTIFRKRFGVATYFCFYFKREKQNKKEKTLNVTPDKKRQVWENRV